MIDCRDFDYFADAYLTRRMSLTQVDVFNERDVSIRMPIQRVKNAIERHHIQHLVNRFQYFTPVLDEMKSVFATARSMEIVLPAVLGNWKATSFHL